MEFPNVQMPFFLKIDNGIIKNLIPQIRSISKNYHKVLLITDGLIWKIYGEIVFTQIKKFYTSIDINIIDDNSMNSSFSLASKILSDDIDLIIGLGGGRVLDVSKHAAFMSKIKFISIPTALAHDGIASPIAVLKTENRIKSLGCKVPSGIIIDLDIIHNSPENLKKAGIGDTLSNYTAILDWKLAEARGKEKINDFALLLSDTAFNSLINFKNKDLNDYNFLKQLAESIVLSGLAMNIAGSSRPCSGSEHLISHSMDLFEKGNLHGMQVGVSSIISAYFYKKDITKLQDYLDTFNLPKSINELGFSERDFYTIMINAKKTRPNRYTILDEIELSEKNLENIYYQLFK